MSIVKIFIKAKEEIKIPTFIKDLNNSVVEAHILVVEAHILNNYYYVITEGNHKGMYIHKDYVNKVISIDSDKAKKSRIKIRKDPLK